MDGCAGGVGGFIGGWVGGEMEMKPTSASQLEVQLGKTHRY